MAKSKNPVYTTPRCKAVYPYFNKPDEYKGAKNYKADLVCSIEEGQPLIDLIDETLKKYLKELEAETGKKINPAKCYVPYEIDDEAGTVKFRVKQAYEIKGEKVIIPIFDASATKRLSPAPVIRSGSVVKVRGTVRGFESGANKGVKLQISAVQLLELASASGDDVTADRFGFGAEDGYTAEAFDDAPEGFDDPEAQEGHDDEETNYDL